MTAHFRNGRSMVSESPSDDAALSRMASMAGVTESAIDKKIDETCRYAISALVDGVVDPIIDAMVANGRDSRSEKLIVRKAICLRFAKRIGKILTEEVM